MELFVIDEKTVYNIINSLTLEEKIRNVLCEIIKKHRFSYTSFIYNLFRYYVIYYVDIYNENLLVDLNDIENCIKSADPDNKIKIDRDNILIVNVSDINFCHYSHINLRFNNSFYSDINDQITELINPLDFPEEIDYIDEIYNSIEDIFTIIETNIFFKFLGSVNEDLYLVIHLRLLENALEIYILGSLQSKCLEKGN